MGCGTERGSGINLVKIGDKGGWVIRDRRGLLENYDDVSPLEEKSTVGSEQRLHLRLPMSNSKQRKRPNPGGSDTKLASAEAREYHPE